MKQMIALMLCLALMLSATACGGGNNGGNDNNKIGRASCRERV